MLLREYIDCRESLHDIIKASINIDQSVNMEDGLDWYYM